MDASLGVDSVAEEEEDLKSEPKVAESSESMLPAPLEPEAVQIGPEELVSTAEETEAVESEQEIVKASVVVAANKPGRDEEQMLRMAARNAELEAELEAMRTTSGKSKSSGEMRAEFSARLGQVEQRLRSVTQERDSLKKQMDGVQKSEEEKNASVVKDLRNNVFRLQKEVESAKSTEQTVREEGSALAKQIGKLEGLLKTVRSQLAEKTTLLTQESNRAMIAETKLTETSATLLAKSEDLRKWEGSAEGLKAVGARAAGELSEIKASESELKRKLAESQQQLETALEDLSALRKDASQKVSDAVEASRVEASEAREKWKRNAQQKASEWADREKSLKENLQALRAELARKEESYEWRIHAQTEKERDLKTRLERTEGDLAQERSGRSAAQAPLIDETRKLREAVREAEAETNAVRGEWRAELEQLNGEKRALRAEMEALESERDKWKEEVSGLNQKAARLESKCAEALATMELERGTAEETHSECETLRVLTQKLRSENDRLKAEHAKMSDELIRSERELKKLRQLAANASTANVSSLSLSPLSLTPGSSFAVESASPASGNASMSGGNVSYEQIRLRREVEVLQAELVRSAREAQNALLRLKGMEELERMLSDIGKRHAIALEILGEREHELKALKGVLKTLEAELVASNEDLDDVKTAYRRQILEITTDPNKTI